MGAPSASSSAHGVQTNVWTPYGGWFPDPKAWKRNTLLGFAGVFLATVVTWNHSRKIERRSTYPTHWIPSQMWSKNFPEKNGGK